MAFALLRRGTVSSQLVLLRRGTVSSQLVRTFGSGTFSTTQPSRWDDSTYDETWLREFTGDSAALDWTPLVQGVPDPSFYETSLREPLRDSYSHMSPPAFYEKIVLVSVDDLVDVATRYPSSFRRSFFDELCDTRIIVNDPSIFPGSFSVSSTPSPPSSSPSVFLPPTHSVLRPSIPSVLVPSSPPSSPFLPQSSSQVLVPSSPSVLRGPIQVLVPSLPPRGWVAFYCDGTPGRHRFDGGGGLVSVTSTGEVGFFGVRVPCVSSFLTETLVVFYLLQFAQKEGIKNIIVFSDSADTVDGLNGRRRIRSVHVPLFRKISEVCSHFKNRKFIFMPREGLRAADEIGRFVRRKVEQGGSNLKIGDVYPIEHHEIKMAGLEKVYDKVCQGIPSLRVNAFTVAELTAPGGYQHKMLWCPAK